MCGRGRATWRDVVCLEKTKDCQRHRPQEGAKGVPEHCLLVGWVAGSSLCPTRKQAFISVVGRTSQQQIT